MLELRLSKKAEADLAGVRRYSDRSHGAAKADAYLRGFTQAFARIREHPRIGSRRTNLPNDIRGFSYQRHVILSRLEAERVFVVRIVHQSQDTPPLDEIAEH